MMQTKFAVGDLVTKSHGKKVAKIIQVPPYGDPPNGSSSIHGIYSYGYLCRYLHGSKTTFRAFAQDLKLHIELDSESTMSKTPTLYSFTREDGSVGYGTYLATNSNNQIVVEEKRTGNVLTFDKDQLEEVLPYTFSVKFSGGVASETHFIGNPGSVEEGDFVMMMSSTNGSSNFMLGVVSAVDTKNKSAKSKFKGVKLTTQTI